MPATERRETNGHDNTGNEVLIIGAGLAGMSAAIPLGPRATILEASATPGGLVRSLCFDGYWFDHVIHLLYLPDDKTKSRIRELLGDVLGPCPPVALVESLAGCTRYPFQFNLGSLGMKDLVRCIAGFVQAAWTSTGDRPAHFEEMLRRTFGGPMCEMFFFPYNRKMWKRPLRDLAPSGFQWNIDQPGLGHLLKTIVDARSRPAYNGDGWYPRPESSSPVRGMGYLSFRLASLVHDVRLGYRVTSVDLERHEVNVETARGTGRFIYRNACISTVPLPFLVRHCTQAPGDLLGSMKELRWNRVRSVGISVKGPRPVGLGHWRYYADESLIFTRLVLLHEFDPAMAPPDGWPLLVEVTEPAETPPLPEEELLDRVLRDVHRVGILPAGSEITAMHSWVCDPAYVVFTPENEKIIAMARTFLLQGGVVPLGRYGHWEYSSMGQVIRDAHAWAEDYLAHH